MITFCLVELRGLEPLTLRLQSSVKVSSIVAGLGLSVGQCPSEVGSVQARWCRLWVSPATASLDTKLRRPVVVVGQVSVARRFVGGAHGWLRCCTGVL
jgi:hypothetical protein